MATEIGVKLIEMIRAESALQTAIRQGSARLAPMSRMEFSVVEFENSTAEEVQEALDARIARFHSFSGVLDAAIDLRGTIRAKIADANAAAGVSRLLTERATVEAHIKTAETIIALASTRDSKSTGATILAQVKIYGEQSRSQSANVYGDDKTEVNVSYHKDTLLVQQAKARVSSLKKRELEIKDAIASINRTSVVPILEDLWNSVEVLVQDLT